MRGFGPETAVLPGKKTRSFKNLQKRTYQTALFPSIAVLVIVILLPALFLIITSFTPLSLINPESAWDFSQPFSNFIYLAQDARFLNSLWVQFKLSFFTVAIQLLAGLGVALLLYKRSRFVEACRTIFLIPMVLPPIVVAIIWKVLYTPDISPVLWVLRSLHLPAPSVITEPGMALWAIIVADIWEWFPFTMLMLLAALQMMPDGLLEAARIDGANAWQIFLYIILPLLRPALLVSGLFRLIDSIKAFPLIYILTQGGPGTVTEVTNFYAFIQAFNFSYLGYSSAITLVMVVITFLLSWMIVKLVGTKVEIE